MSYKKIKSLFVNQNQKVQAFSEKTYCFVIKPRKGKLRILHR